MNLEELIAKIQELIAAGKECYGNDVDKFTTVYIRDGQTYHPVKSIYTDCDGGIVIQI